MIIPEKLKVLGVFNSRVTVKTAGSSTCIKRYPFSTLAFTFQLEPSHSTISFTRVTTGKSRNVAISGPTHSVAPSLLAIGGSLRARNIIGAGEVLVARSAIIGDVIYLEGPHSGARVDELRARTVVENSDNRGVFGRIRAQQHFAERLGEVRRDRLRAIGRILGVVGASSVEMIETSLRRAALG